MDFIEAAKTAKDALEDKKAEDIKILDLRNLSSVAECFVIASGNNINQLKAMADNVEENCIILRVITVVLGFFLILTVLLFTFL